MRNASFAVFFSCLVLAALVYARSAPARAHETTASAPAGYAVAGVHYDLYPGDLTKITRVWFTLTPDSARDVQLRLATSQDTWYPCDKSLTRFVCKLQRPIDLESTTRFDVRTSG
jgi:hypothetical protein